MNTLNIRLGWEIFFIQLTSYFFFFSLGYLLKLGSLTDWDEDDLNSEIDSIMVEVIETQRKRLRTK